MKDLEKKIKKIEETIHDDDFQWGSTRIDPDGLTESEKKLFSYLAQLTPIEILKPENLTLLFKARKILVRYAFDAFMMATGFFLSDNFSRNYFWYRFVNFLSDTLLTIFRDRGEMYEYDIRFGEYPDSWPDDDDPALTDYTKWCEEWEQDFDEHWKKLFPNMKKILPKPTRFDKEGTQEFYGKIITAYLAFPHDFYVLSLVLESHQKKKSS